MEDRKQPYPCLGRADLPFGEQRHLWVKMAKFQLTIMRKVNVTTKRLLQVIMMIIMTGGSIFYQ